MGGPRLHSFVGLSRCSEPSPLGVSAAASNRRAYQTPRAVGVRPARCQHGMSHLTRRWHADTFLEPCPLTPPRAQQAEAELVGTVAGLVVVAIRRPAVPGVVVPATAPVYPVRA